MKINNLFGTANLFNTVTPFSVVAGGKNQGGCPFVDFIDFISVSHSLPPCFFPQQNMTVFFCTINFCIERKTRICPKNISGRWHLCVWLLHRLSVCLWIYYNVTYYVYEKHVYLSIRILYTLFSYFLIRFFIL